MEFIEKTNEQIINRIFEAYNDGYRYEIKTCGSYLEMKIYPNKEIELEDGSVYTEKSLYPIGIITLKDGVKKTLIEGDIDKHITVFDEFLNTLQ